MKDANPEIDTSVLDDLVAIRHEQAQLVAFRARADEMKARVDARVYERVVGDYDRRESALTERAAPLEARARVEFRKLRTRHDAVTETRRSAEFDKAEIEFRHSVGEIDDEALAQRIRAPEDVLATCQAELGALEVLKARFVEAYADVEAESAQPEGVAVELPAVEPAASAPIATATPDLAPDEVDIQAAPEAEGMPAVASPEPEAPSPPPSQPPPLPVVASAAPEAEAEAAPEPEAASGPEAPSLAFQQAPTQLFEVPSQLFADPEEPPADAGQTTQEPDADATFILPDAVLVDAAHGLTEFRLGAMNYIGRADDNQIRLKSGDISRRHAMISASEGAYLLRDLQSQNGTFVNGQRIASHVLADGDRVRVGNIELVFHYTSSRGAAGSGAGIAWARPGS